MYILYIYICCVCDPFCQTNITPAYFLVSFVPLYHLIFLIFWSWDLGIVTSVLLFAWSVCSSVVFHVIISSYICLNPIVTLLLMTRNEYTINVYIRLSPIICCFANTFCSWHTVSCFVDQVPQRTEPGWFHESPWLQSTDTFTVHPISSSPEREREKEECSVTPSLLSVKQLHTSDRGEESRRQV